MITPYQRIEGCERVIDAFGYWPSFHDAEVRSVRMDRNTRACEGVPEIRLDVCLHAFEWTQGPEPTRNHHLVEFRFHDIEDLALEGFNHQNAILEFRIEDHVGRSDSAAGLRVTIVPAHGLSGSFCASSGEVLSVVPCDELGSQRLKAEQVGGANSHPPAR